MSARRSWVAAALAAALLALAPRAADAHSQPFSWVDLRVERGRLSGDATAHVVDLAHVAGLAEPDSLRSAAFVAAHRASLERALIEALRLSSDGRPVRPAVRSLDVVPEKQAVRLGFDVAVPAGAELRLDGPLFTWEAVHETYFNVRVDGVLRHQDLLDSGHRSSTFALAAAPSVAAVVLRFAREGVHHIFIGPDHVLFVLALLLLGGGARRLAKIVTAFTVAHSLTLALATFGVVDPPSRLVESAIALSIVVVGVENLLAARGGRDVRAALAFAFGFVHGFGFASVLRELSLPPQALGSALFAFNAGVEVGQLAIVFAAAPLLGWLRARSPRWNDRVLAWGSFAVIAAGGWWFVQRALLGA